MTSICLCTWNRYDLTVQCVGPALENAEADFELLSVDQGSEDKRVIDYIASLNPVYHRLNEKNEGYAHMLNQMLLRAKGDYLCVIDNDIELPKGWLRKLVEVNKKIPNSGISSYHCVLDKWPAKIVNECEIHPGEKVHGIKFFSRDYLNQVGYFCEEFPPYGNEDCDLNRRSIIAGRINYYLGAGDVSFHRGEDSGEKTPYRQFKWDCLKIAGEVLTRRFEYMDRTGDYYVPPPLLR
jgi:glycosyltransferase involved in cell wall biosynthesis